MSVVLENVKIFGKGSKYFTIDDFELKFHKAKVKIMM